MNDGIGNDMVYNFDAFIKDIEINRWNVWGVEVYDKGKLIQSLVFLYIILHIYE